MKKTILIISSDHTGHGHKSITESLNEQLKFDENVDIHVVDGFSLGGKFLLSIGKSYAPITRKAENVWKFIWNVSSHKAFSVNRFIETLIKHNFLKLIKQVQPDLILSVHPNFNGSVLNILEKEELNIPFVTLIADLVNIYPLWADKRADYILCPTKESKAKCLEFGLREDQLMMTGFPVRERFYRSLQEAQPNKDYFTCLIMSGGEGVGNMEEIAENLLTYFNCKVKIVAGRNEELKTQLESSLVSRFGDKVEIFGFVTNVQDLMFSADIAFTRGSPNVMYEAFAANVPIVITGALPGQEEDNPTFAEKNHLGVICKDIHKIKPLMDELLDNNREKLNEIKRSQAEFVNRYAAKEIVNILKTIENQGYELVLAAGSN